MTHKSNVKLSITITATGSKARLSKRDCDALSRAIEISETIGEYVPSLTDHAQQASSAMKTILLRVLPDAKPEAADAKLEGQAK